MPPEAGDPPAVEPNTAPPAAPAAPAPAIALTPEQVRNSPEYQELLRSQHAALSRAGRSDSELARVRTEAEQSRQAAEAERLASQAAQVRTVLGDEGVAEWTAIAELSLTDSVAAATRFREFATKLAQNQPPAAPPAGAPTPPAGGSTQVPPPTGALGGNAPLGQPPQGSGWDEIIADAEARYSDVVQRNQDPATRSRVTMRDRAAGIMAFVEGAYAQAFRDRGRTTRN